MFNYYDFNHRIESAIDSSFSHIALCTERIPLIARVALIQVLYIVVIAMGYYQMTYVKLGLTVQPLTEPKWMIAGFSVLLAISLLSTTRKTSTGSLQYNRVYAILYYLCAIMLFASSLLHGIGTGFQAFSLGLLLIFPILYLSVARSYTQIRHDVLVARAVVIVGIVIEILCLLYLMSDKYSLSMESRPMFLFYNPGLMTMNMAMVLVCCLYLIYLGGSIQSILVAVVAFCTIPLLLLSQGRTSIVASAASLVIFYIFSFRKQHINKKMLVAFSVALVAAAIATAVFTVLKTDEISLGHILQTGEDVNSTSSGRIEIWNEYAKQLTTFGKDPDEYPIFFADGTIQAAASHNLPLDFAYRSGVFTGIAWLLLMLYLLAYTVRKLVTAWKSSEPKDLFCCMCIVSFVIISALSVFQFPFTLTWSFLGLFCFGYAMFRRRPRSDSIANF